MSKIDPIKEALEEFVDAMDSLSRRFGLTARDVADILNPIGDKARAALKEKNTKIKVKL